SGIVHTDVPGTDGGVIYVASSNFDRRFDFGSVLPVSIDKIEGLPPFGKGVPDGGPASITVLPPANPVFIASFAGEMEKIAKSTGGYRLFVPTRSENSLFHVLEADGDTIGCFKPPNDGSRSCMSTS